jgi:hypothetical protein
VVTSRPTRNVHISTGMEAMDEAKNAFQDVKVRKETNVKRKGENRRENMWQGGRGVLLCKYE